MKPAEADIPKDNDITNSEEFLTWAQWMDNRWTIPGQSVASWKKAYHHYARYCTLKNKNSISENKFNEWRREHRPEMTRWTQTGRSRKKVHNKVEENPVNNIKDKEPPNKRSKEKTNVDETAMFERVR